MDGQNFQNNQDNTQESTPVSNYQDNTASVQNQVPPVTAPEAPKQTNALAIVSLVMGILSIVLGCCTGWIGIIFSIAGIICAVFANKQGKTGLATAGMVCSIVGIVIAILITIVSVIFGAALATSLAEMGYSYNY